MTKDSDELELAREVARKAKELAKEKEAKLLSSIRAEFYVQLSEVLKAGIVKAATWHVGEGRPATDLGNANDLYIDTDKGEIYFNNAGAWGVVLNINGKDGSDGKDGDKGDRGATGLAGERGKDGRDGKDGRNGKDGRDGVDGKNGKDGKDGIDGRNGSKWYTGRSDPAYDLGEVGDFYLKDNGDYYEKTKPIVWVRRGSLKGSDGGGSGVYLGETETTAYRGDRGKVAYDHSQLTEGNPHNVTAEEVGLGEVDNTSDADKPISTLTQSALDKKGVLSYDVYLANDTWEKPVGAKVVEVFAIGGGGGGGKGAAGAAGTTRPGGSGGGPGGAVIGQFDATLLADTVAITVGAGGAAGTVSGAFNQGGNGGNSSFGTYVTAGGGTGGLSGNFFLVNQTGGAAGASSLVVGPGGGGVFTGLGFQVPGANGHVGSGAGGAAISNANVTSPALAGGNSSAGVGGIAGGVSSAGGAGTNGSGTNGGAGGGGGGTASAGGNGGANGGAGGGGGAALSPAVAGNGGAGGAGIVIVITYG